MTLSNPSWPSPTQKETNWADVNFDEKYETLFKIRNWRITNYTEVEARSKTYLDGPSMWHKACGGFTHVLSRSYPQCAKCFRKIPERIQTVYTLLNWQYGNKEEYFSE